MVIAFLTRSKGLLNSWLQSPSAVILEPKICSTIFIWRKKWRPTPVLLPGKSHGWRSLVGYSPWSRRVGHAWATSIHSLHTLSLEKEMATHSSVLAWRVSGTEEPGGPWSMASQGVGHDWSDWAFTVFIKYLFNSLLLTIFFLQVEFGYIGNGERESITGHFVIFS